MLKLLAERREPQECKLARKSVLRPLAFKPAHKPEPARILAFVRRPGSVRKPFAVNSISTMTNSTDPVVQQSLNLTPQQVQSLNALNADWNTLMFRASGDLRLGDPLISDRVREARRQFDQNLNSVLSVPQQQRWQELIGEPFDFPMESFIQPQGNVGNGTQPVAPTGQATPIPR